MAGTTTRASRTRITLDDRIQALPQELQDIIRGFTVECSTTPVTIMMTYDYKPPTNLHINRTNRNAFASTYYANTTFQSSKSALLTKFITALSPKHRDLLESIKLSSCIKDLSTMSRIGIDSIIQRLARSRAVSLWRQLPEDTRMDVRLSAIIANYASLEDGELVVKWITAAGSF